MNTKKLILFVLTLILFQEIKAQESLVNKSYVLGGSMNLTVQNNALPLSSITILVSNGGIYSNSTSDLKSTNFSFSPYVGKQLNEHFLVGLQLDYRLSNYKTLASFVLGQPTDIRYERESNNIGFGFYSRYVVNPNNKFNFYLQPFVDYNLNNQKEFRDDVKFQEENARFVELGISAGILYNINEKLRATVGTGGLYFVYGNWEILETNVDKNFSSFGTNINFSNLYFGMEYLF